VTAAAIYLLILLYLFVGVALASDKFMAAIEVRGALNYKRNLLTSKRMVENVPQSQQAL
jgi:hypothetical protein